MKTKLASLLKNILFVCFGAVLASGILIFFWMRFLHLSEPAEKEIVSFTKEQMSSVVTGIEEKNDEYFSMLQNESRAKLNLTYGELKNEMKSLHSETTNIISATEGILFSRQESAKKSYEEAIKQKNVNPELAIIYILSAINHEPNNITYLREYYSIISNKNSSYDDLNEAISILSTCIYQVEHQDIDVINTWIEELTVRQESLLKSNEIALQSEEKQKIENEYNKFRQSIFEIKAGTTAQGTNTSALTERLKSMEAFLSEIQGNYDYSEYYGDISSQYVALSEVSDFISLSCQCENLLNQANTALSNSQIELASEYLTLCDTVIFQLSGLSNVHIYLQQHWLEDIVNKKTTIVNKINTKKSKTAFDEIKNLSSIEISSGTKYQTNIERLQEVYVDASTLMAQIYDTKTYKEAQKELAKISTKLTKLQEEQMREYQNWASGLVLDANDSFEANKKSENIMRIISYYENITNIDQKLIIPEISAVLQTLVNEMYSKVDKAQKRDFNQRFMTAKKKTLEDF